MSSKSGAQSQYNGTPVWPWCASAHYGLRADSPRRRAAAGGRLSLQRSLRLTRGLGFLGFPVSRPAFLRGRHNPIPPGRANDALLRLGCGRRFGAVLGLISSPPFLLGQSDAPACGRAHGALLRRRRCRSRGGGSRRGSCMPSYLAAEFRYLLLNLAPFLLETD